MSFRYTDSADRYDGTSYPVVIVATELDDEQFAKAPFYVPGDDDELDACITTLENQWAAERRGG